MNQDNPNYNALSLEITLNRMGYNQEDINDLFSDPFETLYSTKIGYQWYPSAVGWSQITIKLIITGTLGGITAGLLNQIGTDFYEWVKSSFTKVVNRKSPDFDESRIHIKFEDCSIDFYVNTKEELIEILERIDKIIESTRSERIGDGFIQGNGNGKEEGK